MNRVKLARAGIDIKHGLERMGGRTEVYERMLKEFLKDDHYARMLQAIADHDMNEAYQNAHALKGLTGSLSIEAVYQELLPLVEELKAGREDCIEELLKPVTVAYHAATDAIR